MRAACLLVLLLGSVAWAQRPTVSAISIDALDTTSFRVFFTATPPTNTAVWSEVLYGTSSGSYPYNTKSTECYKVWPCQLTGGTSSLLITGLAPGTTYYLRVTARPNPNDDTNICKTDDCGSVEQVVTTLSGAQPAAPIPPTSWRPALPDTSSYTVIPLQVGSQKDCEAASAVSSPDGWSVRAGDNVFRILNEIGYGAVIELPQGIKCLVPPTMPGGNPGTGYTIPSKPLDSNKACGGICAMTNPNHRWIVFRTRQTNNGDFPPFGARTDPSYAPRLGKFYSAQPNNFSQIFQADAGTAAVHHIWWENLEFEDDPAYTNPPGVLDPAPFQYFAQMGSQYQKSNNQFLVFDRIYAHAPGPPVRHLNGWDVGGNFEAMIGCYTAHVEISRMTGFPSHNGTLAAGNRVMTVPQNNFRFAANSPLLGMIGPAVVTLGAVQGAGTVIGNLYQDHLEVQYSTAIGAVSCTGCTATAAATPATPPAALQLFYGTVTAAGQFSGINWNTQEYQTSRYTMAFGMTFSDLKSEGGPYLFDNNYLDGVGEGIYIDPNWSSFSHDDVTYTHNHEIWPKTYFAGDPGNLWRYDIRQHFEMKRGHRYLIKGNVFSYSWGYQNDGPSIFLSGRPTYIAQTKNDGISDVTIDSNTISHGRDGITCQSGDPTGGGEFFEPEPTKRVEITNTLMFDLGRWKYCDWINCPSFGSFYFEDRPGCQDLVIRNTTADVTWGDLPALIFLGGGGQLANHLTFQNNILHFSKGISQNGGGNFGDWDTDGILNHNVKPVPTFDNAGPSPNFRNNLAQAIVNTAQTVTPHYSWSNNVLIGGFTGSTLAEAIDMTYAQVMKFASNMPPGDIYPAGDTIAARQAAAGLDTRTWRSSMYNSQGIGADIDSLDSAMGLVTGIVPPVPSRNSAVFSYTAPDARVCAVDVSSDGAHWIRQMDAGGARARVVTVIGLTPLTLYQSKILCYYTQQNDGVLYTDYTPDEITTAGFSTTVQTLRRP